MFKIIGPDGQPSFAIGEFVLIFTIDFREKIEPLVLVRSFDIPRGQHTHSTTDKNLGLFRVSMRSSSSFEVIHASSIVRGALAVPTFDRANDRFIVDLKDEDMFLRLRGF